MFNKPIKVLKNIGQTLSTTVREGLPKHISTDRNHKCSHNSDYITIWNIYMTNTSRIKTMVLTI